MTIAAPSIVRHTADGKILLVWPLKPVPVDTCPQWNARIAQRRSA